MFAQILLAFLAVWLFYIGVVERSIFNIIVGIFLIISSAGMFYAARSGSSFQEEITKWYSQRVKKSEDKL